MRRQKPTQPSARNVDELTEADLLARQFTAADPESLEQLSDDPPPDEAWEVEYIYDMTGRDVKVRCVFCKYLNHYTGAVVKYGSSGTRRLVGNKCAFNRYGIEFDRQIVEFNVAAKRQDYVRRRRHAFASIPKVTEEFRSLQAHPAVRIHDSLLRAWRGEFPELSSTVGEKAKRDELLVVDCVIRDETAERARKERLGNSFESEKRKAKAEGRRWLITKRIQHTFGTVAGPPPFLPGASVARRLQEIQTEAQRQFLVLAVEDQKTEKIEAALNALARLIDDIKHEFDRLDALPQAFDPDNLRRIADWANDLVAEDDRRAALLDSRRHTRDFPRYTARGSSITDNQTRGVTLSLPAWRVPKRTLIDCLTEAISLRKTPPIAANSNDPQR
jgi:hypothetical protein